jgi:CheY-like chemotaxis protein
MSATSPVILVVEDNPANLLLVKAVLRLADLTVVEATTVAAARVLVRDTMPDLVLMDVRLPDGDGLELTRELKASPVTAAIPVLVLTAHAMKGDGEAAAAAGCDGFITKPIDTRTLADEVRRHLARASPRRPLDSSPAGP